MFVVIGACLAGLYLILKELIPLIGAWNSGVIRSFGSIFTSVTGRSSNHARALAVENATKISPDPLPPNPPCRPMPSDTRVAMRFS